MKLLGILFLLCVLTMPVLAQDHCRIMFYNVENLFDTADDPSTADDEFTPRGKKHWTKAKYTDKLLKIAEVIDSVGDKELPCIIGLAEVENRWVLEDLTQKTALADGNYGIVHQDSPDRRGIDVALLYRKKPISCACHFPRIPPSVPGIFCMLPGCWIRIPFIFLSVISLR